MLKDLTLGELLSTQLAPAQGRSSLLWAVEEIGEVAAVIKKKGDAAIMEDAAVRAHFVEEMCDVLMYLGDTALCYGVTAQELANAFAQKHIRNMGRDFRAEYKDESDRKPGG